MKLKSRMILLPAVLGLIMLIFIIALVSFGSDDPEQLDFRKKETLTVVTDYSPIGYFVAGDSIEGINNDLIKLIERYSGCKINVILESSLEKSLEGLINDEYDILARGIPVTSDMKEKIMFSDPIMQTKQVLVQRKQLYNDSIPPVRSHLDLAGKTLYVPKYSPAILRIKNLSEEIGDSIYYVEDELYGEEQLAIMVAQGEIDLAVCDEKIAKKIAKSQPELDIETTIGFTQFESWAVNKSQLILLDSLNSWIHKAKQTKELNKILKRYLH